MKCKSTVLCAAMAVFAAGTWAQDVPQDLLDAAKAGCRTGLGSKGGGADSG